MKITADILIFVTIALLLACEQTSNQNNNENDSLIVTETKKESSKTVRQQIEDKNRNDSLRLCTALDDAFKIAKTAFKVDSFTKEYELRPNDSSYAITIEIIIGRLFKDNHKYFLLRRHVPWASYIDLYSVNGDMTENLITREQHSMTYIRDTIFDVNGDGHRDFLVHWYPSSGCCRRDVYNVYLNQPDKGKFTNDYEFINPTFSANERVIRGIEYGHPGEVGLYKYRWNGFQVDTLEFIYPDVNNKGQFIKTKKGAYRPTKREGVVLESVPKEYENIESYEWFADF